MSGKEIWFERSDGRRIATTEGSAACELMSRDGGFRRLGGSGGDVEPDLNAVRAEVDLTKFKKAELLEYAAERGIEVSPKATAAAIIEVIKAAKAEAEQEA